MHVNLVSLNHKCDRKVGEISLYSASRGVSIDKRQNQRLVFRETADSIAKVSQGRKSW